MKHLKSLIGLSLLLLLFSCSDRNHGGDDPFQPDTPTPPEEIDPITTPPGNTTVIYEANPLVFSKRSGISAISNRLEDISSLGVNVLWLMPVFQQGSQKAIGSPYCVRDYKLVNPNFGTLDDLKSLVSKAHSMGMKVILDWVANHTSWDNQWITDHPEWYTQDKDGNIVSPNGWNDVADLNYDNGEMRKAMIEAMKYWVEEVDIDGYRCDHTDGVPEDFWKSAIDELREIKGNDLLMLGETSKNSYYNSGFDMMYAWSYCGNLPNLYSSKISLTDLINIYDSEIGQTPPGKNRMRYIINHDTASSDGSPITLYNGSTGAMAAFVMSIFLKGVPMIYSSQEVGYASKINFFNYVEVKWNTNESYTKEYRDVMRAYLESAKYRGVAPDIIVSGNAIVIVYQASKNQGLVVFANTGGQNAQIKLPANLAGKKVKNMVSGISSTLPSSSMNISNYAYRIFEFEP